MNEPSALTMSGHERSFPNSPPEEVKGRDSDATHAEVNSLVTFHMRENSGPNLFSQGTDSAQGIPTFSDARYQAIRDFEARKMMNKSSSQASSGRFNIDEAIRSASANQ